MKVQMKNTAVIYSDEYHTLCIDAFLDELPGISSNLSRDEDLGYATFYIDVHKVKENQDGWFEHRFIWKMYRDICITLRENYQNTNYDSVEVNYKTL